MDPDHQPESTIGISKRRSGLWDALLNVKGIEEAGSLSLST